MSILKAKKPIRTMREKERLMKMMREPSHGDVVRVNGNIPAKLHSELKLFAAMDRKEIKEILAEIIQAYVKTARRRHYDKLGQLREELNEQANSGVDEN